MPRGTPWGGGQNIYWLWSWVTNRWLYQKVRVILKLPFFKKQAARDGHHVSAYALGLLGLGPTGPNATGPDLATRWVMPQLSTTEPNQLSQPEVEFAIIDYVKMYATLCMHKDKIFRERQLNHYNVRVGREGGRKIGPIMNHSFYGCVEVKVKSLTCNVCFEEEKCNNN